MTERDPRIPELLSLTEAAELLGTSKTWITRLHQRGHLVGQRVGHTLVLAAAPVRELADARRAGFAGWSCPSATAVMLPELLSTTAAADRLGLSQRVWIGELYRRGVIPGQRVGRRTVVFAASTIDEIADERRVGLHRYLAVGDPG